jgi:Family of unknown function (DUF6527)
VVRVVKAHDGAEYGRLFHCPGCDEDHVVTLAGEGAWTFNGDDVRPTFSPSFLFLGDKRGDLPGFRCHSQITDGRIRFYEDTTHALSGLTVGLLPC